MTKAMTSIATFKATTDVRRPEVALAPASRPFIHRPHKIPSDQKNSRGQKKQDQILPDALGGQTRKKVEGKNLAAEGEDIIQKMNTDGRAQPMKGPHIAEAETKEQIGEERLGIGVE